MSRRLLLVLVVTALATIRIPGQDAATATIVVSLPADARLSFDGSPTQQTGASRTFVTPPLDPGQTYTYELRAAWDRDGQPQSETKRVDVRAGQTVRVTFGESDGEAADQAPPPDAWPRKVVGDDGTTITIYQPQVERWERNRLESRAAVAVQARASPQPIYGVAWFSARTAVDKEQRMVALDDIQVTRVSFPSAPERADAFRDLLRRNVPAGTRTVALDRIEANLAVTRAEAGGRRVPVKNDPPRILYSTKPAVLVLVDGKPALRQVAGIDLLRVINTRALLLFDQGRGRYYLHLMDRWMTAGSLDGPWSVAEDPPAALQTALDKFADDPQVDLYDNPAADVRADLEEGVVPAIHVSAVPTELIETRGNPDLEPIARTALLWVKNTTDQILLDTDDQHYYVLLSGRWFRTRSLSRGPWAFVPADKLPADFARVPQTHPRGDVLASVAGTPQAEEAQIADQVPQTATIRRGEARMAPVYDGEPQFQPIAGTPLSYAVNTPTPVVQVAPDSYYGCDNGVWFTAAAPVGPWTVATSVPEVIYTIPPSVPIYYVTYVYVYGFTPEYVYTGYLPGYFGTCLTPFGVVVYGTGWAFRPWIGAYWFGRPWSYGWGARFAWTEGGWGLGFATAFSRPWWGPVGWAATWGGRGWRPGWERGWGGRFADAHINHINFANFNVYNRWGDRAYVNHVRNTVMGPRRETNVYHSRRDLNNVLAGPNGRVYRRAGANWEMHTPEGWRRVEAGRLPAEERREYPALSRGLDRAWAARRAGEVSHQAFRAATGNVGGYPASTLPRVQQTRPLPAVRPRVPTVGYTAPRYTAPRMPVGGLGAYHGGYGGFRGVAGYHPAYRGRR